MSEDSQRASDAEREAAADWLRDAATEGRLDPDELDERVGKVYAARTHGELALVTDDLPEPPPRPVPIERWKDVRERAAGLLTANLVCNAVWLATGTDGDWWPKWVLLATGIAFMVALLHAIFDNEEDRPAHPGAATCRASRPMSRGRGPHERGDAARRTPLGLRARL